MDGLPMYVIYENPTDYPGKFVLRRWVNDVPDHTPMIVADYIESVRKGVPYGLHYMPPDPTDDPVIKEIYI